MARVSVITALYNHEKYIAQAIESVMGQTYADWEHLIWDDGSTDRSVEIAQQYADKDSRVKVFRHTGGKNRGQENTRNAALAKASGELICLLDSDDLYYSRKLELLVPCFEKAQVGLAYGRFDHLIEKLGMRVPSGIANNPSGRVFGQLAFDNFIGAGATLFRRACVESGLKFDPTFKTTGEYPLWLKIARDWDFAHVPDVVATWRDHGENLGSKLALQAKAEQVRLFERLSFDPGYSEYAKDIQLALVKRHYDYASVLYANLELENAQTHALKVVGSRATPPVLRAKAALLAGVSKLPPQANRYLAKAKQEFWALRRKLRTRKL